MRGVTQIGTRSVMYSWLHPATLNPGEVGGGGGLLNGGSKERQKKKKTPFLIKLFFKGGVNPSWEKVFLLPGGHPRGPRPGGGGGGGEYITRRQQTAY